MENKIRISSCTKKIEVNDAGEYIVLPLSDDSFVTRFYRMLAGIQEAAKQTAKADPESAADIMKTVDEIVAVERETRQKVDELFGAETCRKVFGDVLPSMDLFVDFFAALVPFFEEYKQHRAAKMSKYGANRTGSAL